MSTVVIAAACGGAAGILLLSVGITLVLRRRRRKSAPLPPVQPLAHHREWRRTAYFDRQSTYLMPTEADDSSISLSTSGHPLQPALPLPNPSFSLNSPSRTSLTSSDNENHSPITPSSPISATPSIRRVRSRPLSMSSTSTAHSRPHSTFRGAPHNPHSQIQIVLPAPLGPNTSPQMPIRDQRISMYAEVDQDRFSLADKWAPALVRTESTRDAARLLQSSATSLSTPYGQQAMSRRSSSFSSSTNSHSTSLSHFNTLPDMPPPPVPPIPSIYSKASTGQSDVHDYLPERGRRDSRPRSTSLPSASSQRRRLSKARSRSRLPKQEGAG